MVKGAIAEVLDTKI